LRFYKPAKYQAFISQQGLSLIVLALAISLFCGYLAYAGKMQGLGWLYYDKVQKFNHLPEANDLVVIEIDDKSISRLGRWPWPRRTHAQLLDALSTVNTKAIIFDVLFPELDANNTTSDQRFAQAIKQSDKVILPIYLETLGQQGQVVESPPHELFYAEVKALGHVHLESEADGVVRAVYLKEGVGTAFWPHLSLATLMQLNQSPSDTRKQEIPGRRASTPVSVQPSVSIERDFHNFIPMPSANQGLRHYSYSDIVEGAIDLTRLDDKVVYIGATAAGLGDILTTPIGTMTGVELNAWIFQALRHNQLIQGSPEEKLGLITFMAVLFCVLILGRLSPRLFLISSVFSIAAMLASSAVLLLASKIWLSPVSAIIGLVLFFPLWSWLRAERILRFLRDEIEELSATTKSAQPKVDSQPLALHFLEKIGIFDLTKNQPTQNGELAISALYSDKDNHYDPSSNPNNSTKNNTEFFWQRQIEKHDARFQKYAKKAEGVELIARTISQLSSIKQSDQKNRQLVEKSLSRLQDAVCIADLCGEITFINKRFEQWFHRKTEPTPLLSKKKLSNSSITKPSESLLKTLDNINLKSGLNWSQVLSSLYQTGKLFSDEATLVSQSPDASLEQQNTQEHDRQLLCQVSLVSINEIHHDTLILTFTDITQLKAAENARAEALSFLSHDLRSPMVSVLAILDQYHSDPSASNNQYSTEALQSIETLVRKNLNYAESFLQLSRADALLETNMSPCDLHAVLDGAQVFALALASPKSINVVVKRCDEDAWVLGDINLLERAMNNLISNAIKFSPSNSSLNLVLQNKGAELKLSVEDQGIGIDKEDEASLFKRFTRSKRTGSISGAGLGLNFVHTVVKKHGGTITLDSQIDVGTSFSILLPALSEQDLFT